VAVYKRSYKVYDGPLTPARSRFLVLSRYSWSALFESRLFTSFTLLCFSPLLIGGIFIYVVHSPTVMALVGAHINNGDLITNIWFWGFLQTEIFLAFILGVWAVPGMMIRDFANQALQLYLSRPLSRAEYLLGKISAAVALLSAITWIPGWLLFALQAQLEGHGWGGEHLWLMGSIFLGCMLWITVIVLLAMALSVWVKWRIVASILMLATFMVLAAIGEMASIILDTQWGRLLNLNYVLTLIETRLFRIPRHYIHAWRYESVPVWAAWASFLAVCLICLWVLNQRLRAREVERG